VNALRPSLINTRSSLDFRSTGNALSGSGFSARQRDLREKANARRVDPKPGVYIEELQPVPAQL
jgi:hypothetical protein